MLLISCRIIAYEVVMKAGIGTITTVRRAVRERGIPITTLGYYVENVST